MYIYIYINVYTYIGYNEKHTSLQRSNNSGRVCIEEKICIVEQAEKKLVNKKK